ncbi:MAG: protein kinase, partial [Chloroflexota bacterium]
KINDFGISRDFSEDTRTHCDVVWVTPKYFSPEQAAGEPPSPASDVYSIGIIMYELLGNDLPFKGDNPTAIALKHLQSPPPHIRTLNKKVPPQMAQILHKVLAKEPAGRYRTAGQLQRILETYQKQAQESTSPFMESLIAKGVHTVEDVTAVPKGQPVRQKPSQGREAQNKRPSVSQQAQTQTGPTMQPVRDKPMRELKKQQPPAKKARQFVPPPAEIIYNSRLMTLGIVAVVLLLGLIPLWFVVARVWGAI